ncbi:MAG TPA: mechanosensitive ion channel domain-containing protein [Vicinamibacterales bacterium]|nr:mechanosensitive ion channel domain-containing protein [Vicinamibacterales bacterium]
MTSPALRTAALLLLLGACAAPVRAQITAAPTPHSADQESDAAAEPAAVRLGGDPVIWIVAGIGPYSTVDRAARISTRLGEAVRDRSVNDLTVTIGEAEGASELRCGTHLLMRVTQRDAAAFGVGRATLAQEYADALTQALRTERQRYLPATLFRSGTSTVIATVILGLALWALYRLMRGARRIMLRLLTRQSAGVRSLRSEILSHARVVRSVGALTRGAHAVLTVLLINAYLTYVLGLFPWTRPVSTQLLEYELTPIRAVAAAFVGYLPKLLFVLVIAGVLYLALRIVNLFFRQVEQGRIVFANFPAEWADPTCKIVRVLLVAFGLIVVFPYLPASDSPAFAGVSVFMGVLFSLASSSALSNMIAGIALTYTGAFRVGDRIKLGDTFGDVVETSLLVTRVRTIKNEKITIPNSVALGTAVTNYSRLAGTAGLILHTTVTIGYATSWRVVHDLLIAAASKTPGILAEPRPFVWQTALNDFFVSYELNAYTAVPRDMIDIYAALHLRIQDEFGAAGVEIMSPHYTAFRDGNPAVVPGGGPGASAAGAAYHPAGGTTFGSGGSPS